MENLTDRINQILALLEDSREENNWDLVSQATSNLESIYEELDRADCGYTDEY